MFESINSLPLISGILSIISGPRQEINELMFTQRTQKQIHFKSTTMNLKLLLLLLFVRMASMAQDLNNVQFPHMQKITARKEIKIPNIRGYQTLKCDFHIHTIFSDGDVWPTVRLQEAWKEGLDAIAITDHIEKQPSKKYVGGDHNASYEIAQEEANEKNILLIRAGEVTRSMPPGHLNALFLDDVNPLDTQDPFDALMAAKKQGAFIIWNHPGWKAQQPDTCLWMPMHQELFEKDLINGIEVFNEQEYYPIVLDWCLNRNISVISNSDIHDVAGYFYDLEKEHRPMTLVFAKERNLQSLKEAMFEHRTLAYFNNKLAGKKELLEAIFKASISAEPTGKTDNKNHELYEVKNISSIPFIVENMKGQVVTIPAESTLVLPLELSDYQELTVQNLYTGSRSVLHVNMP